MAEDEEWTRRCGVGGTRLTEVWSRRDEEEWDEASETADGRGWDRGDTPLQTIGAALNTNIKAMYLNKFVDLFDLLYVLLMIKSHGQETLKQ